MDMNMMKDYYGFYCDKYKARLAAVGYEIVAVTEQPTAKTRLLKIRSLYDTEVYTVDATDDMVNLFVEDMRRKRRESVDRLVSNTVITAPITNIHERFYKNMLDPLKCVEIYTGNLVSGELTPKCIQRRGTATIVHWKDGTQTKIVRQAGTEDAGLFAAFCMALSKKIFGTTRNLERAIQEADEERQNAVIEEAKLAMKKRHEERMEQNRKRALKRQRRLERRKIKREEEYWKMNLEQMNDEAAELIIRKVEAKNDHK